MTGRPPAGAGRAPGLEIAWAPLADRAGAVTVRGEVDLRSAPRLAAALRAAEGRGATRVLVDLTEVASMDSAGLGALIRAHQRLAPRGGLVVVAARSRPVRELFTSTSLDRVIALVGDREAGLAALISGS
jgi:anti-sigma B factor antagonist